MLSQLRGYFPCQISWEENNNSFETFTIEATADEWSCHIRDFYLARAMRVIPIEKDYNIKLVKLLLKKRCNDM